MVIARQSISLRKKSVSESKLPTLGVKTLSFAHQASDGDTNIPFSSLNEPTAWLAAGRSNPTATELMSANLFTFRNNVTLSSSVRGLILPTEYRVSNNQILFTTFTALANEIFIVNVSDYVVTGTTISDVRPISFATTLAEGETDVLVGESWPVGISPQAVIVFRNGKVMIRNSGNSSLTLDGNYYEVATPGTNVSNLIRFNVAGDIGGESIFVMSAVGLIEKPAVSILQSVETLAGQIDAMIPDLAMLASEPETKYQVAANNIDLRTFSGTVFNLKKSFGAIIAPMGTGDYPTIQDAINDLSSGDKITILPGTYTENIVLNKNIFIEGSGSGTILDGTVSLNAGSSKSMFKYLKFNDDVTASAGVKELIITDCWIVSNKTITVEDPLENIVTVMQES
jgi:hypothetical protein